MTRIDIGPVYSIKRPVLPLQRGSTDAASVKLLQSWLVAMGYDIGLSANYQGSDLGAGIDGDFGGKTETACRNFAHDHNVAFSGVVDSGFYSRITAGMDAALALNPSARTFGDAVVEIAFAHLVASPRESRVTRNGHVYGRDNSGPWVDLYNQNVFAAWCNGFTATIYEQAARALGVMPPVSTVIGGNRLWVPNAAAEAKRRGVFLGGGAAVASAVKPGSLFMVPNAPGSPASHRHIGIVVEAKGDRIVTIEGNTNDGGSAEGVAVLKRERPLKANDYSLVP